LLDSICVKKAALLSRLSEAEEVLLELGNQERSAVLMGNAKELATIATRVRRQNQIKADLMHAF
jgi:hypothetical protein